MKKHYNITIFGNVRNVGFRFCAMQRAYIDGVAGYIKYSKNNSIFIEVEGEDNQLQNFLTWCRKGPVGSKVENIEILETEQLNHFSSFDIHSAKIALG